MSRSGTVSRPALHPGVHEAFLFASEDEFASYLAPFVADGLDSGQSVLVVSRPANEAALRSTLGNRQDAVRFVDARAWYVKPVATLAAYDGYVRTELDAGQPSVRIVGEVVWPVEDVPLREEWTRYEAAVTPAFAPLPVWVICPYDMRTLPEAVIAGARATHRIVVDQGTRTSGAGGVLPLHRLPRPLESTTRPFEAIDLSGLDRHIAQEARRAGLDRDALTDVVAAVTEVALNAFVHARSRVSVSTWHEGGDLLFQVEDDGPGIDDPLTGFHPPSDPPAGWGLWLARHLSAGLEIGRGARGAAVRMRFGDVLARSID